MEPVSRCAPSAVLGYMARHSRMAEDALGHAPNPNPSTPLSTGSVSGSGLMEITAIRMTVSGAAAESNCPNHIRIAPRTRGPLVVYCIENDVPFNRYSAIF